MSIDLGNGIPIAQLLAQDGSQVVGLLYLWETGDIGILWTGDERAVSFVDRQLNVELLRRARSAASADIVTLLECLPVTPAKDPNQDQKDTEQ